MGRVIVTEFISIDGVIEDPGGSEDFEHGGWSFQFSRGDDGDAFKLEELRHSDALLLGRVTYERFAEAWPQRSGDEFSDTFNDMPKFVVSSTLTDPQWKNSSVITGDLTEEVNNLKQRFEKDLVVHGSATLAQALHKANLVDEWRLMTFPVILGHGKRLFSDGLPMRNLKLVSTKPVGPDGVVVLTYGRTEQGES